MNVPFPGKKALPAPFFAGVIQTGSQAVFVLADW